MYYTLTIDIDLPRQQVVELFDNPENMQHWQPGLLSYRHLQGQPGHPGAKMKLHFKMGTRDVEMIETITSRNLPEEIASTYSTKGVWNLVVNRFEPLDASRTRWIAKNEFQFSGMMKVFSWFMPGVFKKQTRKMMEQFKRFAESEQLIEAQHE